MKIMINRPDGVMLVDGVGFGIDVSELPADIRAIQFDTERSGNKGSIQFEAETDKTNQWLTDFAPYQEYLDRWNAKKAAHDSAIAEMAGRVIQPSLREKALEALLIKAALDPLAPQEVKDYVAK